MTHEKFDPTGYDIEPHLAELYKRAFWTGEEKANLVTGYLETMSVTASLDKEGIYPDLDNDGKPHRKAGESRGLAGRICQIENHTDFRLIQIVPHSSAMGTAFFRRTVPTGLSVPEKLAVSTDPEPQKPLTEATE